MFESSKEMAMSVLRMSMGLLLALTLTGGKCSAEPAAKSSVKVQPVGAIAFREKADLYILTNSPGMTVAILPYSATVASIKVPDPGGEVGDVLLGICTPQGNEGGDAH